ncbi:hypothetical protein Tco_1343604 [Tanacetum coccineum]
MHNNIMAAGSMGSSSQCLHRGIMPQWRHSFFTINDTRKTNGWDALKEIAILEVTYITSMSLFKILPAKEQEFLTIVPEPNNRIKEKPKSDLRLQYHKEKMCVCKQAEERKYVENFLLQANLVFDSRVDIYMHTVASIGGDPLKSSCHDVCYAFYYSVVEVC